MMELLPELTMIPSLSPPFFTLLPSSALAANYQTSPKSNGRSSHGSSDVLEKDEKLCDYYRRMPVLYDKSHPHYKFQSKKEKAWRELSRLCEMDVEQCKKRMTYFRCRFTVERRIMKNGVNCSEWPLLEKLKFLNKHIKIRRPRAPNGEPEDTDDETNPMNILRKRQREQQEDAKDDLHAYLDLQQMAVAAQNPQAQLHYQQQLKLQGHGFGAHPGAPGFPPTDMSLHHLQPPPPHPQSHRDHSLPHQAHHQPGSQSGGAHPSQLAHGHHPFRGGLPSSSSLHHQQQAAQQAAAHQQQQQQQQHHHQQQQQAHHHHHHAAALHAGAGGGGGLHGGSGSSTGGGHQQPTPAESPIPAISNVEASYSVPKRQRVSYDGDEGSLSNFNLNRTVKYQNNLEHNANLDEHGAYGLYVGEVLRKLPERISSLTSLKIMQLLYEAQVQSFESTPSSATGATNNGNTKKDTSNGGGAGGGNAAIGGAVAVVTASLVQNGTAAGSSSEGRQSTESAESSKE